MKKLIALISLLLCVTMVASSAMAVSATWDITKNIVAALDAEGLTYTVKGITDDKKDEKLTISFGGEKKSEIALNVYVRESVERIQIMSWNVIEYDEKDYAKVLRTVNSLNNDWVYVKFICDESDNTVTAEFDAYAPTAAAGEIAVKMVYCIADVIDDAYETLAVYAK